ncbi:MAG: hypothetical protein IJ313_10610 [Clostridia bacterium]|nr:hypothetical protein [Clostridia bacterium]
MSSPVFKSMSRRNGAQRPGMQSQRHDGNDQQFMQMANQISDLGRRFQGDPEKMVMEAVNDGRISQKQFEMVQGMAKKIQAMMVNLGF